MFLKIFQISFSFYLYIDIENGRKNNIDNKN